MRLSNISRSPGRGQEPSTSMSPNIVIYFTILSHDHHLSLIPAGGDYRVDGAMREAAPKAVTLLLTDTNQGVINRLHATRLKF